MEFRRKKPILVNGVLLLYHHPLRPDANTIMEHVNSFEKHSKFKVWKINTELGFPKELQNFQFRIIIFHYSVFCALEKFSNYLEHCNKSYKIVFFQDEYWLCQRRFEFLNHYHIDCLYTILEPTKYKDVYQKYTKVPKILSTLTGYVGNNLIDIAKRKALPDQERSIDIGYRARELPYYLGRGGQEKTEIAIKFKEKASNLYLKLDIETKEEKRIYGIKWFEFLGNCKGCLGVESGVSIFDFEGVVYDKYLKAITANPNISFEEMSKEFLSEWEDNLPVRTISPRHFEAAAFRVCQILYEGEYAGILKPMIHYIPLKKDFSNFDEVISLFRDQSVRKKLTDNAYRDLIASGEYSYDTFIKEFDEELLKEGFQPSINEFEANKITKLLIKRERSRYLRRIFIIGMIRLFRWIFRVKNH